MAALALAFVKYNLLPSVTSSDVPEKDVINPGFEPTKIQPLLEYIKNAESPDFFNSIARLFCKLLDKTNLPPSVRTKLITFNCPSAPAGKSKYALPPVSTVTLGTVNVTFAPAVPGVPLIITLAPPV